jgi:hypothetical protein
MASYLLAEHLHTQTRLKFDETARELMKLEGSTRKEVCAAVKAFNKNQVYTPPAQSEGKDMHTAASQRLLEFGGVPDQLMPPALTEGSPHESGR